MRKHGAKALRRQRLVETVVLQSRARATGAALCPVKYVRTPDGVLFRVTDVTPLLMADLECDPLMEIFE